MEHIKRAWLWISAQDPDLSADQKLSRWTNLATAGSVMLTLVTWAVARLYSAPSIGLLVGLVAWIVLLNTVVARGKGVIRSEERSADERLKAAEKNLREAEKERDSLKAENDRFNAKSIQKTKRNCLDLPPKLFRFAQERDDKAPPEVTLDMSEGFFGGLMASASDPKTLERNRFDDDTRRLYSELFGSDVRAALDELQTRGWLATEERKKLEEDFTNPLFSSLTQAIRQIAEVLEASGKRL